MFGTSSQSKGSDMQNASLTPTLKLLRGVLVFKIGVTVLLWAGPLLLFPISLFETLMGEAPSPISYARLLGVAYLALIVNYAGGFIQARRGLIPWVTIWTGLVSNGGGLLMLTYLSLADAQQTSPLSLVSVTALAMIVAGLIVCTIRLRVSASAVPVSA